jgi:serine/threonine-protein kinase Chk1
LAIHKPNRELLAVKIVRKGQGNDNQIIMKNLLKEVKIHGCLSHKNIIQLYNTTEDDSFVYLIMEYAAAGELFDRIAPDVGLEEDLAHLYFQQRNFTHL